MGDTVFISISKNNKTDATFSLEEFTVLARQGAKVVLQNGRGVQYTRNVADCKKAIRQPLPKTNPTVILSKRNNSGEGQVQISDDSPEFASQKRPRRDIKMPNKLRDMVLYQIDQ